MNKLFLGIATLTGAVIGAGFLGIPYVVSKSGFLIGLGWMIIICIVMMLVNLMLGQIILSSKTIHHIPGYAGKYLGKKTKIFVFIASIIGYYAALIAYLLGEGESLSFILIGNNNEILVFGLLFWVIAAGLSAEGIRSFKKIEPIAVILVFFVTFLIGVYYWNDINFSNLSGYNFKFLFYPFGVILFAFLGTCAIPEMKRVLTGNEKLMRTCIIIGSFIPLLVYVLFSVIVLGLYGKEVTEVATISLGRLVILLGMFTMFTAFLALSLALQDTYRFDFKFSKKKAWIFAVFVPLICFIFIKIFNLADFVRVLSIGGSVSGGFLAISVLLIHEHIKEMKKKTERKPEFRVYIPLLLKIVFMLLFVAGIIYEFL